MSKHNAVNMIENSIWNISFAINKQKYIIIEKSMLAYETIVWYISFEIKNSWKKIIFKLKVIQEKALRRLVDAYKITATKILKIEIHILLINIHLKRLLQNSIINMNAKRLINAIETTMQRIKKKSDAEKKIKIKITNDFIADEKRWMRKHLKKTKTTFD